MYVCLDACVDLHKNRIIVHNLISSPNNISGLMIYHCMDLQINHPIFSLSIYVSSKFFNINGIMMNTLS